MNGMTYRQRLQQAAVTIASNRGERACSKWVAFSKLFIQPRRNWSEPGAPRVGWKRGELFEVLMARDYLERCEELGDVGYYVAQTCDWLWRLYVAIVDEEVIANACAKFERRAAGG